LTKFFWFIKLKIEDPHSSQMYPGEKEKALKSLFSLKLPRAGPLFF